MVLMSDESGPGGRVINDARRSHLGGRLITSWPLPVWGRNEKGGDGGGEHLLQPGGKISNMLDFHQPNHFINIYISIDGAILLLECIQSSNHISEDLN